MKVNQAVQALLFSTMFGISFSSNAIGIDKATPNDDQTALTKKDKAGEKPPAVQDKEEAKSEKDIAAKKRKKINEDRLKHLHPRDAK